jgi:hypothetical protein
MPEDRPGRIPDVPSGPTKERGETHPDAPDLPAEDAAQPAKGNQTGHPGEGGEGRDDQEDEVDRPAGGAEEILPTALDVDWHLDRGSDPESPLAGLLAAAAASPQPLDERAYRAYRDQHGGIWPSVDQLVEEYGSFGAAMRAAGIEDPDRF